MRIAYVCSDFSIPIHGHTGAAIRIRELSRALQRLGHEVVIFSPRRGGDPPPGFDVEVVDIGLEAPEKRVYDLLSDDRSAGEAAAREVRALLYATALRYRLHGILGVFRPDAIYERYSLLGSGGLTVARGLGLPLIVEVNAPLTQDQEAQQGLAFGQTARALERTVLREADRVVAVARPLADWLEEIGVAPERIAVLPNAVDVERFAAGAPARESVRAAFGIGPAEPVVGFVGTLSSWHGAATLVRAVAALRRRRLAPRLLVVGEGPERANLEALARSEGIAEATIFAGSVPHEQMPALLAAMDVATAPYDWTDDFSFSPLKLFEAMAAGRPIVAAATGQVTATIREGETGLLYPPGDTAVLANALTELITNPKRAAALGRAAQAEVGSGWTWEANAQTVVELIEQIRRPRLDEPLNGVATG